ncbi:unnamed protein product [Ceutorhynchus assimilis]|uniref:C2H2-type domain-containing protein n=1 Tax=Ceutorhynchus assimilis TaxID=467358 RepID=A0A9N9QMV0_9CUCU|nr:unnamed protein product [Ceutorhynchus assimilis]
MDTVEVLINQALSQVVTSTQCKLCEVQITTPAVKSSHFSSRRHKENVTLFKNKVRQSVISNLADASPVNVYIPTEAKPFHCKACSRKFGVKLDLDNHNSTESHLRNVECYCSACCLLTPSKQDLWEHLKTGTHNSNLVALGYPPINGKYSPFCQTLAIGLKNQMHADWCFICKAGFRTIKLCIEHYTSLRHEKAAELWFKTYCGMMNAPSKQEVVNQAKPNQAKPKQSIESKLAPKLLKLPQKSILHAENQQRAQKQDLQTDLNSKVTKSLEESKPKSPNYCDTATNMTENAQSSIVITATKQEENLDDSGSLKNKVFIEIEKLVQKLYYSKEVPYNVGLNYLKKINKEVDEIIATNNDKKEKRAFSIELDEAVCSNNNFNQNGFHFTGFTQEKAKPLLYPVNFENPIDLVNASDTLENNVTSSNNQINPENNNTEIKASNKKRKRKKPTNNKSIPDLLADIISKKQNCKENVDELEFLNEIEVLLKQLGNVEEGPLLEDILKCLQGFNKELVEIDLKKLEDDKKIENVTENIAETVEPKSKFVYSKNDLLSLDPLRGNRKENPTSVSNNYSGGNSNPFKKFVDVHQECSFDDIVDEKNLEVDEYCEIDIYSYYSGTDFNEFVNFIEVYLQGSIEYLTDEP